MSKYLYGPKSMEWRVSTGVLLYRSAGIVNSGLYVSFMPYTVRRRAFSCSVGLDLISSICCNDDTRVLCSLTSVGFTSLSDNAI